MITKTKLIRNGTQLIPTNIALQTKVINTIPQSGDYFDYFYYLMENDLACYRNAVNNASFLFPCSFLTNHFTKNRVSNVLSKMINQSIEDIKQINLSFVIDNTLFPYPNGAYSYSDINVDIETIININVSSSYETLGVRLIFINSTVFIIFAVIITAIIYKTSKLTKKMNISKKQSANQENNIAMLEDIDEYGDSFISDQYHEEPQLVRIEEQDLKEELMEPYELRESKQNAIKVKSGLIQYTGSRI